jgi:endonuclease YncB( thermonuclease family)
MYPRRPPPRRRSVRRRYSWAGLRLTTLSGLLLGFGYMHLAGGTSEAGAAPFQIHAAVDVIDGDTFRYNGDTIRIADIDTPEVNGECASERALARQATDRLETLLGEGPFSLEQVDRDEDRYGRKLRIIVRDGESIGQKLVDESLARRWIGRRRPWCGRPV